MLGALAWCCGGWWGSRVGHGNVSSRRRWPRCWEGVSSGRWPRRGLLDGGGVLGRLMRTAAAKHGVVKVVSTKVAHHYRAHSALASRAGERRRAGRQRRCSKTRSRVVLGKVRGREGACNAAGRVGDGVEPGHDKLLSQSDNGRAMINAAHRGAQVGLPSSFQPLPKRIGRRRVCRGHEERREKERRRRSPGRVLR